MSRMQKPFTTPRRSDSNTFQLTLNPMCGLPARISKEWRRRSFHDFPDELAQYRNPKTKAAAETAAFALIHYLKKKQEEGGPMRILAEDITVGRWVEKFTSLETSPRTGVNAAKNRPYSPATTDLYKCYFDVHLKDDPIAELKMAELDESDILEYTSRLSLKKLENGNTMAGSRTFAGVLIFLRMAFKVYQKRSPRWFNPFQGLDPPQIHNRPRDALSEDEVVKLFFPGVLEDAMEVAVCAVMFLSGLRRAEISALKPDCLDWRTPQIMVKNAWQNFDKKSRVYGPTKGKRVREAPFDPILQAAVKRIWAEYGQHEYVFSFDGKFLPPAWIRDRFHEWLKRAGIELGGRELVPHSARHSLASLLEERGVPLRYIQDLLGHSDLRTTKIYLHTTKDQIRKVGEKITEAVEKAEDKNIVEFKTS